MSQPETSRELPAESGNRKLRQKTRQYKFISLVSIALMVSSAAVLAGYLFMPDQLERVYGATKTAIAEVTSDVREDRFGELPTVTLGVTGGTTELDGCDGTFTQMTSYEGGDVPPVWAAHNGCEGDILLPWEIGQHVGVAGNDRVYEVVDIRHTPQVWATIDDIEGIEGELALQTCFYGQDKMKFVGLRPIEQP